MTLVILCGAGVGLGLYLIIRQFVAPLPELRDAIGRLDPSQLSGAVTAQLRQRDEQPTVTGKPSFLDRVGTWAETRLGGRFPAPTKDLDLIGQSTHWYYTQKFGTALVGLLAIPIMTSFGALFPGLAISPVVPFGFGLLLAFGAFFMHDLRVKAQAKEARAAVVRVVVAYLNLVAIKLSAGGLPGNTMAEAANISDNWVMVRIRHELTRADWAHVPPWEALNQFAARVDIPEIGEVGDIMRLAGEQGAIVGSNLRARATSLQNRLLSDEQSDANAATTRMVLPIGAMLGIFLLALIYPVVMAMGS